MTDLERIVAEELLSSVKHQSPYVEKAEVRDQRLQLLMRDGSEFEVTVRQTGPAR